MYSISQQHYNPAKYVVQERQLRMISHYVITA